MNQIKNYVCIKKQKGGWKGNWVSMFSEPPVSELSDHFNQSLHEVMNTRRVKHAQKKWHSRRSLFTDWKMAHYSKHRRNHNLKTFNHTKSIFTMNCSAKTMKFTGFLFSEKQKEMNQNWNFKESKLTLMEVGLWGLLETGIEQHLCWWCCNPIEWKWVENPRVALVHTIADFKEGIVEGKRCGVGESESSMRS